MNFSNITDWTITEGAVKQVTDSLGRVIWQKQTPPTPAVEYFYVEDASGSANTLTIKKNVGNSAPTITVYYSTDQTNWSLLGNTSTSGLTLNIPAYNKVYLKATTNYWTVVGANNNNGINCSGDFNIGGNIMSLIAGDNFLNVNLVSGTNDFAFCRLFDNTDYLVDASKLVLPNTVSNHCYEEMFFMCHNLLTAPALPATTLAEYCYYDMFYNCTSLTTAPALPATTLTNMCYDSMFWGCASLTTAPALPATTLVEYCYNAMFRGCTALTTPPALPATTLAEYCYNDMFTASGLTTSPVLPATTLVSGCYRRMFNGCSNLTSVTTYANDISATNCLSSWLLNVAATGTFHNLGTATYTSGQSGIPTGWTEVNS